jgi:hypothetical protein
MDSRAKPESEWRLWGIIAACSPDTNQAGKIAKGQTQEADHPGWWCFFLFCLQAEWVRKKGLMN